MGIKLKKYGYLRTHKGLSLIHILYAASIVSDMDKEGQTACDWLKAQNLDEYNIIPLQGVMGSAAQTGRSGALTDTAAAEGWNIVNEQTAEWNAEKAQQIVQ